MSLENNTETTLLKPNTPAIKLAPGRYAFPDTEKGKNINPHDKQCTTPATASTMPHPSKSLGNGTQIVQDSIGNKLYNLTTYTGIGYFLNLAIAVVMTDYFLNRGGKAPLENLSRWTNRAITSKFIGEDSYKLTHNFFKTNLLLMGGNFLFEGVRRIENNKRYWVFKANQFICPNPEQYDQVTKGRPLNEVPREELPAVPNEPEQKGIGNAVKRRLIGIGAVIGASTLFEKAGANTMFEETGVKLVSKAIQASGSSSLQQLLHNDHFQSYTKLAALDAVLTGITAVALYMTRPPDENGKNKTPNSIVTSPEAATALSGPTRA